MMNRRPFIWAIGLLTMVGGKVVWGAGEFGDLDDAAPPPAMPDWSPVRRYGGYGAWGAEGRPLQAAMQRVACACATECNLHGHSHASAWASEIPASDLHGFWGALGCAGWAV